MSRFNPRPPSLAGEQRDDAHQNAVFRFQSTPAITGGRTPTSWLLRKTLGVSIHARHHWRANFAKRNRRWFYPRFNPRPPSLAGERAMMRRLQPTYWFQSTPAITGGRTIVPAVNRVDRTVSIHARHHWRANCQHYRQPQEGGRVSIHARHHWRANVASASLRDGGVRVSIHARHHWRANNGTPVFISAVIGFNPRPPSLAGEPYAQRCCG